MLNPKELVQFIQDEDKGKADATISIDDISVSHDKDILIGMIKCILRLEIDPIYVMTNPDGSVYYPLFDKFHLFVDGFFGEMPDLNIAVHCSVCSNSASSSVVKGRYSINTIIKHPEWNMVYTHIGCQLEEQ